MGVPMSYGGRGNVKGYSAEYDTTYITSGSADLNDYMEAGLFYFSNDVTIANVPNSAVNGWLVVLVNATEAVVKQIWLRAGNTTTFKDVYMRVYYSSAWSSWSQVNGYITPSTSPGTVSGYTFSNFAVRKRNGWVYVQVTVETTSSPGTSAVTVCTLPSGYRPDFSVRARFPGTSGGHYFNASITTGGVLQVARYPSGTAASTRIFFAFPVP